LLERSRESQKRSEDFEKVPLRCGGRGTNSEIPAEAYDEKNNSLIL